MWKNERRRKSSAGASKTLYVFARVFHTHQNSLYWRMFEDGWHTHVHDTNHQCAWVTASKIAYATERYQNRFKLTTAWGSVGHHVQVHSECVFCPCITKNTHCHYIKPHRWDLKDVMFEKTVAGSCWSWLLLRSSELRPNRVQENSQIATARVLCLSCFTGGVAW